MPASGEVEQAPSLGVYLHWPFCQAICPYCDFNVTRARDLDQALWAGCFERELKHFHSMSPRHMLRSIFFGGGTPSLMQPEIVARLIRRIRALWPAPGAVEITLEANPGDVSPSSLEAWAAAGITRLSLGVQALRDADLRALGRKHTGRQAVLAIGQAQAVIPMVSFDLIYGRPGQTRAAWAEELAWALDLKPGHLSLYQLTIEPGTAFERAKSRGALVLPAESALAGMYDTAQELCAAAGLDAYEVSNHAAQHNRCVHNQIYWRCGEYVGVGPGAHGRLFLDGKRLASEAIKNPGEWVQSVKREGHGLLPMQRLNKPDQVAELLLMGLRLSEGVDRTRIEALLPGGLDQDRVRDLQDAGLLARDGLRLRATGRGRAVLNAVLAELLA